MIGPEAIQRALEGRTGPEADEILQVDTDAVVDCALQVSSVAARLVEEDDAPLRAGLAASWAQGFMAGVAAAREDERGRSS